MISPVSEEHLCKVIPSEPIRYNDTSHCTINFKSAIFCTIIPAVLSVAFSNVLKFSINFWKLIILSCLFMICMIPSFKYRLTLSMNTRSRLGIISARYLAIKNNTSLFLSSSVILSSSLIIPSFFIAITSFFNICGLFVDKGCEIISTLDVFKIVLSFFIIALTSCP